MLVLSRGPKEEILFPKLGITVKVVRISGNRVRLGVDAPHDVNVIRAELAGAQFDESPLSPTTSSTASHRLRNRLHAAQLALQLASEMIDRGMNDAALATLSKSLREFDEIESELPDRGAPLEPRRDPTAKRALLVEDDENERELLAGYLSLSGFQVDTAGDGLGALVQLSRHEPPNVVLLDMNLPKMDGRQTLDRIRNEQSLRNMRVIAVSGMRPEEAGVQIGPDGVDYWFQKPVDPKALVAEMHRELAVSSYSS
jgi:carbon storage regulator CsrA